MNPSLTWSSCSDTAPSWECLQYYYYCGERWERERTHQTVDSADLPSMDHSSESTSNRAASIIHIIQGVLTINISIVHIIQGVLIINISIIHLIHGVLTIDASIIIQICSQEYWGNHNNFVNNCFVNQYFDQI